MPTTPKLDLTDSERALLRKCKIKTSEIKHISLQELSSALDVSIHRAKELKAQAEFQSIPSIGPRFAGDLIRLGYYSLTDLIGKNGAQLFEDLERLDGPGIDPCVEDQFRLVVYAASHGKSDRQWWDFTEERKQYRSKREQSS